MASTDRLMRFWFFYIQLIKFIISPICIDEVCDFPKPSGKICNFSDWMLFSCLIGHICDFLLRLIDKIPKLRNCKIFYLSIKVPTSWLMRFASFLRTMKEILIFLVESTKYHIWSTKFVNFPAIEWRNFLFSFTKLATPQFLKIGIDGLCNLIDKISDFSMNNWRDSQFFLHELLKRFALTDCKNLWN